MAKSNATAASMAHPPEKAANIGDLPHAHNYPGKKAPKAEKVVEAEHDQAAHEAGRRNSLGVSADGSHKGLPANYEEIGQ